MHSPAPRTRLRTIARRLAPLMLVVLLAGCLLPPSPKTDAGQDVFNLYLIVLGLAAIVFVGVEGFILYAVVRYRRQPGDDVLPEQLHGNNTVEIIWTIIPTVIVFVLFFFSMLTLGEVEASSNVPDATTVEVTASSGSGRSATRTAPRPPARPMSRRARAAGERAGASRPVLARREPRLLRPGLPHQARRDRLRRRTTTERADVHDHRGRDLRGPVRRVLRHGPRGDAVRRGGHASRRVRRLHRGAEGRRAAAGRWRHQRLRDDDRAVGAGHRSSAPMRSRRPPARTSASSSRTTTTVPHDVGIVETDFNGDDAAPGETIVYHIPAMEAGDYTFYCTLHPQAMTGDLTISP